MRVKTTCCGGDVASAASSEFEKTSVEMTTRKGSIKQNRKVIKLDAKSEAKEDLWRVVLARFESMAELEALSEAGSAMGDDEFSEFDDDEEGEGGGGAVLTLGTRFANADKLELTPLELQTIITALRDRQLPDITVAVALVDLMREHLASKALVCDTIPKPPSANGKIVVVGDLHGHLSDLMRVLDTYGDPNENLVYLFNGDFVDRGIWGPEVLLYLFAMRLLYPKFVHLNRGNHETKFCTDRYGFKNDLKSAYPADSEDLYEHILAAFDQLSLCHIVGEAIFVCHGGLPQAATMRKDIEKIKRGPFPMQGKTHRIKIFQALLWSDPRDESGVSARGMGYHFAQDITDKFLADNGNLKQMIRSHECANGGYELAHNGKCTTVFSASNYDADNDASVVVIDAALNVTQGDVWNEPYLSDEQMDSADPRGAWKSQEKSDKVALEGLAGKIKDQRDVTPKQRAIEKIASAITPVRPQLMDKFFANDTQKNGKITGTVAQETLREIMGLTMQTQGDFPWEALGPYLYEAEPDGTIKYVNFLNRFESPFSAWLGRKWCDILLDLVANKT